MESLRILITGGCGFIGSNLALHLKNEYPNNEIIVLDNLRRRGSELNLSYLRDNGIHFKHGDIRNKEDLHFKNRLDWIIDCAAEPSALAGTDKNSQDYLIHTNFQGTINTLQVAAQHQSKFIFLSTSRVYPYTSLNAIQYAELDDRFEILDNQVQLGCSVRGISESYSLKGARTFYGSSKLASELFVEEFGINYGINYIINRCGVIAGPRQMGKVDQGIATLWMARHFWKKELSYIGFGGQGKQVRDILHINDLSSLISHQIQNPRPYNGKTLNVGGGIKNAASLLELTRICEEITGNRIPISSIPVTRNGDIPIYISDCKLLNELSEWTIEKSIQNIFSDIFEWMYQNEKKLKPLFE